MMSEAKTWADELELVLSDKMFPENSTMLMNPDVIREGIGIMRKLKAENTELLEALQDARGAIESLDECALGIATGSDGFQWPIKVELLNKINKAIRKAKEK